MGTSFCLKCKIRKTCKKICKKLEKELKKIEQGRNSRVTIVDPRFLDLVKFKKSENGKRKMLHFQDEADHKTFQHFSANDVITEFWHRRTGMFRKNEALSPKEREEFWKITSKS